MNIQPRILCHFSCGAASAVATKLALDKYGADNCEIINIHIAEEHPDNQRFLKDCERWFGKTMEFDYCTAHFNEFEKRWYVKDQMFYTQRRCKVVYWQALPELPKQKER